MTATLVSLALMQDDGGGAWQCTPTFALLVCSNELFLLQRSDLW